MMRAAKRREACDWDGKALHSVSRKKTGEKDKIRDNVLKTLLILSFSPAPP